MSNSNSFRTDQYVQWSWGSGTAKGQIKERFEREVTRTLKGSEITRDGSEDAMSRRLAAKASASRMARIMLRLEIFSRSACEYPRFASSTNSAG